MARGFKTGGRPPGKRNKRTEVRLEAIKVLLRDGSRQPLDVVLHAMNVEFEQAERAAKFNKARALRSEDADVREGAELIVPDYSKAVDNAVACLPYLHPKLSNVTIEEDKASPEEVEASFNAIVSKLDAIAAKKAVTFIPPGDDKVIDLARRRIEDETK